PGFTTQIPNQARRPPPASRGRSAAEPRMQVRSPPWRAGDWNVGSAYASPPPPSHRPPSTSSIRPAASLFPRSAVGPAWRLPALSLSKGRLPALNLPRVTPSPRHLLEPPPPFHWQSMHNSRSHLTRSFPPAVRRHVRERLGGSVPECGTWSDAVPPEPGAIPGGCALPQVRSRSTCRSRPARAAPPPVGLSSRPSGPHR